MSPQYHQSLRIQGWLLLVVIIVESALGSKNQPLLAAHVILGILLFVESAVLLICAIRYQSAAWKAPSMLGLLGICIAIVGGTLLVYTKTHTFLYFMEFAPVLSLGSYGWGLWAARKEGKKVVIV